LRETKASYDEEHDHTKLNTYQLVDKIPNSLDNWKYFSIWLTMCFFYVGMVMYSMQKEIQKLQSEVQQLQKRQ
jgi:hypothetical protein